MRVDSEQGFIEFRLPDIMEAMELFGKIGVNKVDKDENINSDFIMMAAMIRNMDLLVSKVELKDSEGKVYNSFLEAKKQIQFMKIISECATEILNSISLDESKKK